MNRDLHNRKYLKQFRRELRNNPTKAESKLWQSLRKRQLEGRKFRRQHSIDNYIVDFYCSEEKLIIEVDGEIHNNFINSEYDNKRTEALNEYGYQVVRFTNDDVMFKLEQVLETIRLKLKRG